MSTKHGELYNYLPAAAPVDINGAGMDGDWIDLGDYESVDVVITTGTCGADFAVTLQEATTAAGGSAQALGYDFKDHILDYTAGEAWVRDVAVTSDTFNVATADGNTQIHVINVRNTMLTTGATNFRFFRARLADPAAASVVSMHYVGKPRRAGQTFSTAQA